MSTNYGYPELILQPYKLEVLSLKPRIVLITELPNHGRNQDIFVQQRRDVFVGVEYTPAKVRMDRPAGNAPARLAGSGTLIILCCSA
ncbi:hypothetical protein MTO96_049835 [Rhipicephalus appendiculatus]